MLIEERHKTLYVCGASDCFPDPDYPGLSWMDRVEAGLIYHRMVNLSIEGASNFVIRLQVERAIQQGADFIIVNFTSSVREESCYCHRDVSGDLLDRFYRYHFTAGPTDLVTYSPWTVDKNPVLSQDQKTLIKQYSTELSDIDVNVAKNYFLITGTLDRLIRSGPMFLFSSGGFEHASYMDAPSRYDFSQYHQHQSRYNLWDFIKDFRRARPYFHIDDAEINQEIADYYLSEVEP